MKCKRVQLISLSSALAHYAQLEGGASGRRGPNDKRRRQKRQHSSLQAMSASVSTLDILPTLAIACLPEALKPEGQAWVADLHKLVRTIPCSRPSLPLRWPRSERQADATMCFLSAADTYSVGHRYTTRRAIQPT